MFINNIKLVFLKIVMSVNKKALTYIFLNGRRERINSELNFPYEFFYGYNFLKIFIAKTTLSNLIIKINQ